MILNQMIQYQSKEVCRVFHALGDPTRFAILQQVSRGEVAAGELVCGRNITLTAILRHLQILESAGLTESVKVGRERRCRVRLERLVEIEQWIEETRRAWNFRLDQLDVFLKENEDQP